MMDDVARDLGRFMKWVMIVVPILAVLVIVLAIALIVKTV